MQATTAEACVRCTVIIELAVKQTALGKLSMPAIASSLKQGWLTSGWSGPLKYAAAQPQAVRRTKMVASLKGPRRSQILRHGDFAFLAKDCIIMAPKHKRTATKKDQRFEGRWRITDSSNWSAEDLDLVGPAHIVFE